MTREILILGEEGERIELCAGGKISQVALLQERQVYNLFQDGFIVWGVRGCGNGVVEQYRTVLRYLRSKFVTNRQTDNFLQSIWVGGCFLYLYTICYLPTPFAYRGILV